MKKISSHEDLKKLRENIIKNYDPKKPIITICGGTGCQASGSEDIIKVLKKEIINQNLKNKIRAKILYNNGIHTDRQEKSFGVR